MEVGDAQAPPAEPFDGTRPSADPKDQGLCSADGVLGCDTFETIIGPVREPFLRSPDLISLRNEDRRGLPAEALGRTVEDEAE